MLTWFVEEAGAEIVAKMGFLVELQNRVMSMPSVREFIRSENYYPIGNAQYVVEVKTVLGREI